MKTQGILNLLIIAAIFNPFNLKAQTSYNPKVGLHISSFTGNFNDTSSLDSRVGYQVGIDIRKGNGIFFIQPGVHYRVTSADIKAVNINPSKPSDLTGKTTIQSILVPLNGGMYLTGKDHAILRIYIHGGITPAYILGVKSPDKFDLKPTNFNRFQFAVNGGVGFDIFFLHAGINYEYYLTDFFNNSPGSNRILNLNLGFVF